MAYIGTASSVVGQVQWKAEFKTLRFAYRRFIRELLGKTPVKNRNAELGEKMATCEGLQRRLQLMVQEALELALQSYPAEAIGQGLVSPQQPVSGAFLPFHTGLYPKLSSISLVHLSIRHQYHPIYYSSFVSPDI